MNDSHDQSDESIFFHALQKRVPAERAAYLDEACAHSADQRRRIEGLLRHQPDVDAFLEESPALADASLTGFPEEVGRHRDFGDYELLVEIARGGMGVIYKARQKSLKRLVAVKMLLLGAHAGPDFIRRFRIEASAAAALQHANIVAIHEVGVHEGEHFLVMDLVEGSNLARLTKEQVPSPKRSAQYLKTIAEAIHYAHERGILHRDLKPSNILIDSNDQPRVTDFGLARKLDGESSLTLSGQVLGSPNYMPPKQAAGNHGKASRRSDVYGLGAILYHLLTGRPPFRGDNIADTLQQVVNGEPISPRLLNASVSVDLETICLKCLEKEPERRYHTAKELADDLERFLKNEPVTARPPNLLSRVEKFVRRHKLACFSAAAIFLALLLGLTLATWRFFAEQAARKEAVAARVSEAKERDRAKEAVEVLELQRVDDFLEKGPASEALAHLAQLLRREPGNRVSASRILSVLAQRNFAVPLCPPLSHETTVSTGQFSPDGSSVVTVSADNIVRLWEATTGRPIGLPLRHSNAINSVAFTPDGSRIVTGSADRIARVWHTQSGAIVVETPPHANAVTGVDVNSDGRCFATTAGEEARIWDLRTGTALSGPLRQKGSLSCIGFSRDGQQLLTAGTDKATVIWNVRTGAPIVSLRHTHWVQFADFSPDGKMVAAAAYSGRLRVWEIPSGKLLAEMTHADVAEYVAFSPNGTSLATASRDCTARLWNPRTGEALGKSMVHPTAVTKVRFSPDGSKLLTVTADNAAWLWNVRTAAPYAEPLRHNLQITDADFSPDGKRVITTSADQTAVVWDIRPSKETSLRVYHVAPDALSQAFALFSPNGRRMLTWAYNGTACVWNLETGQPVVTPIRHQNLITDGAWSPDGRRVSLAGLDRGLEMREAETGKRLFDGIQHFAGATHIAFSPDGKNFATATRGGTVTLFDSLTGALLGKAMRHPARLAGMGSIRFTPDGRRLITASEDGAARLWNLPDGQQIGVTIQHPRSITCLALSADGKYFATASLDTSARVWDAGTASPVTAPLRHHAPVYSVDFSPDGRWLLTASGDATARLWDSRSGEPHGQPLRHKGALLMALFSPDAGSVATASYDRTMRLWDVQSTHPLTEPFQHDTMVNSVTFSTDGRWLATGTRGGQVAIWETPWTDAVAPAWLPDLAEALGRQRLSTNGQLEFVSPSRYVQLKARLEGSRATNHSTRFAQWFLADREHRAISPVSPFSRPAMNEDMEGDSGDRWMEVRRRLTRATAQAATNNLSGAIATCDEAVELTVRDLSSQTVRTRALMIRGGLWRRVGNQRAAETDIALSGAIPERTSGTPSDSIDLSDYYNAGLRESWHNPPPQNKWNLMVLPRGRQVIAGHEFDVRGLIQLSSKKIGEIAPEYPVKVIGIQVNCRAQRLHFLHAETWAHQLAPGTQVGTYLIHYADGGTHRIPIIHGVDMLEWRLANNSADKLDRAMAAWIGTTPGGEKIRLFVKSWENDRPEAKIEGVDFESTMTDAAPFLVAITAD